MPLCTLLILLTTSASVGYAQANLPTLGQKDIRTEFEEAISGLRYLRFLNREGIVVQDPALSYYLEQSTTPLLPHFVGDPSLAQLSIMGINDRTFNAFAVPGGLVGVHLGLLENMTETADVQAIIAHELGHLALGHHARLATSARESTAWVIASLLLTPLAAQIDLDLAAGLFYGAQGFAIQQRLAFSRAMEEEADRAAVNAMRSSDLSLQGVINAYEAMARVQRSQSGTTQSSYQGTHPNVSARLADLRNRLQENPTVAAGSTLSIPLCWVQVDLAFTVRSQAERCLQYQNLHRQPRSEQGEHWQRLLTTYPANPYLFYRATQWLQAQERTQGEAVRTELKRQGRLMPDSGLVALSVLSGQLYESTTEHERWARTLMGLAPSNDLLSWSVLSDSYNRLDKRALAFRASAQSSWIKGEVGTAAEQLQRAIELSENSTERLAWTPQLRRWQALISS
ncbi:M48 family metallopeptidase [Salinispirillum marinum]|uniref:M48 family metallopeptidase n=1 Tax=Salinispirillum marinum TaxID=1485203 RepID=UPI0036D2E158